MIRVVVTGEPVFLKRYAALVQELNAEFVVDTVPIGGLTASPLLNRAAQLAYGVTARLVSRGFADRRMTYNQRAYLARSRQQVLALAALQGRPDFVLQIFGLSRPWVSDSTTQVPYGMYLDYTTALAASNYPDWAPFIDWPSLGRWFALEHDAYHAAARLYTMSDLVRESLIEDYGVSRHKIMVVGSGGTAPQVLPQPKVFTGENILFSGADWERKGGPLVLEAFARVRKVNPRAQLTILGDVPAMARQPGVVCEGYVTDPALMARLFHAADVVVAPAACDPFPGFLIEAQTHGVPCIVSAVDGQPEIVQQGESGVVLKNCTSAVLALALLDLLSDAEQLEAMSRSAKAHVARRLNWRTIAGLISTDIFEHVARAFHKEHFDEALTVAASSTDAPLTRSTPSKRPAESTD